MHGIHAPQCSLATDAAPWRDTKQGNTLAWPTRPTLGSSRCFANLTAAASQTNIHTMLRLSRARSRCGATARGRANNGTSTQVPVVVLAQSTDDVCHVRFSTFPVRHGNVVVGAVHAGPH